MLRVIKSNLCYSQMSVVNLLREKGFEVTYPENHPTNIVVNGKNAFIKFAGLQSASGLHSARYIIYIPKESGQSRGGHDTMQMEYCFLVMNDREDFPVYQIYIGGVRRTMEVSSEVKSKWPIQFIGNLRKKGRVSK